VLRVDSVSEALAELGHATEQQGIAHGLEARRARVEATGRERGTDGDQHCAETPRTRAFPEHGPLRSPFATAASIITPAPARCFPPPPDATGSGDHGAGSPPLALDDGLHRALRLGVLDQGDLVVLLGAGGHPEKNLHRTDRRDEPERAAG